MSKQIAFKFKIMDNSGGQITITSIKISEHPTPGSGQPVSATFMAQPTYILGVASLTNIGSLPKMIKIEFTSSNGITSVVYDNIIDNPAVVDTIIKAGITTYTRKGLIVLCVNGVQNIPTIVMVPPTYY